MDTTLAAMTKAMGIFAAGSRRGNCLSASSLSYCSPDEALNRERSSQASGRSRHWRVRPAAPNHMVVTPGCPTRNVFFHLPFCSADKNRSERLVHLGSSQVMKAFRDRIRGSKATKKMRRQATASPRAVVLVMAPPLPAPGPGARSRRSPHPSRPAPATALRSPGHTSPPGARRGRGARRGQRSAGSDQ